MKNLCPLLTALLLASVAMGQQNNWSGSVSTQAAYSSLGRTPFWFRANQFGDVPLSGPSSSFSETIHRNYDSARTSLMDWGMGLNIRANAGTHVEGILVEAYAKARLGIFELKAGRSKDRMGFVDSSLSSGAFSVSGNALGIPKVEGSIPEFYAIPFLGKIVAFKGNFAHGWLGDLPLQYKIGGSQANSAITYFHQKSLYGRFGKPNWKLKLYGGFNHQVFWGNEKNAFGANAKLSKWETYQYVVFGKVDQKSKVGNHLGSIDLGMEYDFNNIRVTAYRQSFYDVGALAHLANVLDGLHGLSVENKTASANAFKWKKILVEVFYSMNQAGESWSKYTPSGDEDYYNNYIYTQGWSYKGMGLGNPLISQASLVRKGQASDPRDYFINNRVAALHLGMAGSFKEWAFTTKLSYSLNYGTYGTSLRGHTTGNIIHTPKNGLFKEVRQFSSILEINRNLENGLQLGFSGAADIGRLYNNAVGGRVRLSKFF